MTMKSPAPIRTTSSSPHQYHPYARQRSNTSGQIASATLAEPVNRSDTMVYAKPFDRYQPRGGGAQQDIFRRFKIRKAEEEEFMVYWSRTNISSGIFTRDDNHTLVFRVSCSDLCDLSDLGIGRAESRTDGSIHWTHVYDEDGISWLTQFRCIGTEEGFPKVFDDDGQAVKSNGRIGHYGPSGLNPADFFFSRLAIQKEAGLPEAEHETDTQ